MKNNNPLESLPVSTLLFKLAMPSILAQVVSLLYSIVDRIYISHIPVVGTEALSGIGITTPLIVAINSFANLISMGGAPLAAIELGKKNTRQSRSILWNCLIYTVITSFILMIVLFLSKNRFLQILGADDSVFTYANDYLTICVFGSLFSLGTLVVNTFLNTQGKNKISMIIEVGGTVFNLIFDPLFIFVFKMGVKGAAIVTVISQIGTTIAGFIILLKKDSPLYIEVSKISFSIFKNVILLGVASFIMRITESFINIVFNNQLIRYGGLEYVAVHSIIFSITQMIILPITGMQHGAQPILSYTYGSKNQERMNQTIKLIFVFMTLWTLFCTLFLEIFASPVFKVFTSENNLLRIGIPAFRLMTIGRFFTGAQWSIQTVHSSVGAAKRAMSVALVRKVLLIIPLAYLLPAITGAGVSAVFLAEPVSDILAQCFAVSIFIPFYKNKLSNLK